MPAPNFPTAPPGGHTRSMAGPPRVPGPTRSARTPGAPLTNIGTTDLQARPDLFGKPGRALFLDRVNPDPLWISRWQNSATPIGQPRPWVIAYRWWEHMVPFASWGPDPLYRIDIKWRDYAHAYIGIPQDLWYEFRGLTTSVGQWFHRRILGPDWKPGKGALFEGFPL